MWELTSTDDDGLGEPTSVKPKWKYSNEDPLIDGKNDIVFFVHGFNNTMQRAEQVWRRDTYEALNKVVSQAGMARIVLFYWSGCGSTIRELGGLLYPDLVKNAAKTADHLARYLADRTQSALNPIDISFVAHSLGCRVVLETLQRLESVNTVRVRRVLLMAGAVAEGYCVPWERFGFQIAKDEERVLWSTKDSALKVPFRLGQRLAEDQPESHRRAIGRRGGPSGRWSTASCTTNAGHGDYWSSTSTVRHIAEIIEPSPSAPVARSIDRSAVFRDAPDREGLERDVFDRRQPGRAI